MKILNKFIPEIISSLLLIVVFVATRLLNITSLPIFTDEAIYTRWAQIAKSDSNWRFISLTDGKNPSFIWADSIMMKLIDDPLLAGRLVSVFAGFLVCVGIYFLTREIFASKEKNSMRVISLIAVALTVLFPFLLVYDRLAIYESMTAAFFVWSLYFQILLVRRLRLDLAMILGFILGGSVLTKSSGFLSLYLTPVLLLLFNFSDKVRKQKLIKFIVNPCVIVSPGHRGVIVNLGAVSDRVLDAGVHFRMPLVQSVIEIDTRVLKEETKAEAASKDLQNISTVIAVNYHLKPDMVNDLYKTIGLNYESVIIDPAIQEVLKGVTAKYTAAELITLREQVSHSIKAALEARLEKYHIVIDDFSIKDFQFSATFAKAIESKQEAEQLALKAERDLQRIKIEAEQQIATARAEAETLRLKNVSVSPLMIQLNAIDKWDGKLPQYMLGGNSVPFINIK
jgi:hypothetical protein